MFALDHGILDKLGGPRGDSRPPYVGVFAHISPILYSPARNTSSTTGTSYLIKYCHDLLISLSSEAVDGDSEYVKVCHFHPQ